MKKARPFRPLLIFFAYGRRRGKTAFIKHDLFGKPVAAFPGHAPTDETTAMDIGQVGVPKKKNSSRPKGLTLAQQVGIVLGSGTLVAAAIGTYLVVTHVSATAPMPGVASAAMPRDHSGAIIVRAADGKGCRRMKFNNATGTISDDGPASCDEADAGQPPPGAAAAGTANSERFGAIANGFRR
jgi:hypothetical protein